MQSTETLASVPSLLAVGEWIIEREVCGKNAIVASGSGPLNTTGRNREIMHLGMVVLGIETWPRGVICRSFLT
jgi:hypothetical protein